MATTIDDVNNNLAWFGSSWGAVSMKVTNDNETAEYYDQTFHRSTGNGEYCIIAWHGTDIAVYGARRNNHGIYGVSVDGGDAQFFSGYSADNTFQQVLYATTNLEQGDHTIKMSNENAKNTDQYPSYIWFDVDYVAFTGTLMQASNTDNVPSPTPSTSTDQATPSPSSSTTDDTPSSSITASSSADAVSTSTAASTSLSSSPSALSGFSAYPTSNIPVDVGGPTSDQAQTSGTPVIATNVSPSSSASSDGQDEGSSDKSNKTTAIAVSVTIIVVAVVVIATVAGLWYLRRRKRRREEESEKNGLTLQNNWR